MPVHTKSIQLVFTVIAIVIYSSSYSQGPSQQNWKAFHRQQYSINYPATWAIDTSKAMGTAFTVFAPLESDSDKFQANVSMLTQDLAGQNITLDNYTNIAEHQLKASVANGKIEESTRVKTAKGEYHKIIFIGTQGANNLKFEQFYFIKNNYAFVVTLATQADEFDNYRPTGEQILHSFVIK